MIDAEGTPRGTGRGRWILAAILLVAAAMAVRGWLLFRTAVPPGVDAGYYPYQSRTLLVQGRLAYDDVPLRFALDAALTAALTKITSLPVDDAALWVSRAVDAAIHPTIALALVAFAAAVGSGGGARPGAPRRALLAACAASSLATLSGPILDMVGDFEKQSMALALAAAAWTATWWALRASTGPARWRRFAAATLLVVAATATHVGTGAAAGAGTAFILVGRALLGDVPWRRIAAVALLSVLVGGLAWTLMWCFAPAKATALLSKPISFLTEAVSGSTGDGGPPGAGLRSMAALVIASAVCGVLLWFLLRRGRGAGPAGRADAALAAGMVLTVLLVTNPLLPGQYVHRVGLIAFTPVAFLLVVLLGAPAASAGGEAVHRWLSPILSVAVVIGSILSAGGARGLHMPPAIDADGLAELRAWGRELGTDFRTVVVARHGLEWWTGFAMGSAVRLAEAKPSDFERYETVLMLRERRAARDPDRGDRPPGPPPRNDDGGDRADDRERRPRRGPRGGPPGGGGPGGGPGGSGSGGDHMRLAPVPANATVLRESERFTLYRLPRPDDAAR